MSFCGRPIHVMTMMVLTGAMLCAAPSTVLAKDSDKEYARPSPVESGEIVRRKLLFRSTRLEVAPLVGFTLADPFNRNVLAGANLSFHLTNTFGIGATFGYGVAALPTSLRENLEASLPDPSTLATAKVNWAASVEGSYVPLFGKLSIMNGLILNYDLHALFGVGFVSQSGVTPNGTDNAASSLLSGSSPAPVVGFGGRFYLNDFVSFNAQLRDYILNTSQISGGTNADGELQNRLMLSVGFSFFLPKTVKVSR